MFNHFRSDYNVEGPAGKRKIHQTASLKLRALRNTFVRGQSPRIVNRRLADVETVTGPGWSHSQDFTKHRA